ncbi:hypothetical protein FHX49_002269 [Microbacterium endophyticum]|uniref:Uncharacterized protein n=1 Tax=Microbacterium endophyticum TaxID=1526412 RepID=A0A7W4YMP6_9MICO|nr:DUF6264 family protein [Microbacterium endophyticum]MBB2976690.1 hypothetical protein [Microbacterium endophyticum]NIK37651.1 hypothetical protein [Microbacterium endophyticum]
MSGKKQVYTLGPETYRISSEPPVAAASSAPARERDVAAAPRRRRRTWDLWLTISLLVLLAAASVTASVLAVLLTYAFNACGSGACSRDVMNIGVWVSLTAPWIAFVIALALSIVLLIVRRLAFWVPLASFVLVVGLWNVGAFIVWAGVVGS